MLWSFISLFLLRLLDMTLFTMRFMMTLRGRRLLTWVFAFLGALAYVIGVRSVLGDMSDWAKLLGYGAGFASGMLLGVWLEERLAMGYTQFQIISPGLGAAMAEALRDAGFAATEVPARGRDSSVTIVQCCVPRRCAGQVGRLAYQTDPEAFITEQDVTPLWRGYWPN